MEIRLSTLPDEGDLSLVVAAPRVTGRVDKLRVDGGYPPPFDFLFTFSLRCRLLAYPPYSIHPQ